MRNTPDRNACQMDRDHGKEKVGHRFMELFEKLPTDFVEGEPTCERCDDCERQ